MNIEQVLSELDKLAEAKTGKVLNSLEKQIIRSSWEGQTYDCMDIPGYATGYIKKNVAPNLWKLLSALAGEQVSKKNFTIAIARLLEQKVYSDLILPTLEPNPPRHREPVPLKHPGNSLPASSPFYIDRPPIESDCHREILEPGSLILIKAPKKMGKTSLLNRILARGASRGCQTVSLNLSLADREFFDSTDQFLRWFCANVTHRLGLPPKLDNWEREHLGSTGSCTKYFEKYLLEQIDSPLILGLDEVDRLFECPDIARSFFALLRVWHEEANNLAIWQKLRLVVVRSTAHVSLDIHQSPFNNVGFPVNLPELTLEQVQNLAKLYGLDWVSGQEAKQLQATIGGHPYLVQLALYHLWHGEYKLLSELLAEAPTLGGIYGQHLRDRLSHLQKHPELAEAFKKVVDAGTAQLEPILAYRLEGMGLVQCDGDRVKPSCELYRQYFYDKLLS